MKTAITFKGINRLAIPATIAGIAEPLLSITDTAIVGNIPVDGVESLAAAGIVGSFLSMLIWVLGPDPKCYFCHHLAVFGGRPLGGGQNFACPGHLSEHRVERSYFALHHLYRRRNFRAVQRYRKNSGVLHIVLLHSRLGLSAKLVRICRDGYFQGIAEYLLPNAHRHHRCRAQYRARFSCWSMV